jgi:glucose/arabinose dehydrogenase
VLHAARRCAITSLVALLAVASIPATAVAQNAGFFGSMGGRRLNAPVVSMAATRTGRGYWLAAADGGVFTFGDARFFGSAGNLRLAAPVVGMAARPQNDGYWLLGRDGGVFNYGGAPFFGSAAHTGRTFVDLAPTPRGHGYWLTDNTGTVNAFGTARSLPSLRALGVVKSNIVAIASTATGRGYWLVAADGGVFALGDARFFGSLGGRRLNAPIVDVVPTPDGRGYWLMAADGGVFTFGTARFHGSTGCLRLVAPVVSGAATRDGGGYWLAARDGGIFGFPTRDLPCPGAPALHVSTVVGGLDVPWDLGFLPGGTMLFTERAGRIDALIGGARRVLGTVADVRVGGEGGLLGMAIDPQFAQNRFIYACYDSTHGDVRVAKWHVANDLSSVTFLHTLLIGLPENPSGRHSGCRPRFGPDGFLWIGTGDAAMGTNPQNDNSLGGKVLRVDKVWGLPAPGNPGGRRWYTKGHRNVQGLAFQPGTGQPYAQEQGTFRDDELNRLVAGGNYGYNPVPGYNESVPMTFAGAIPAVWSSGPTTIATSGMTFLSGRQWRDWNGAVVACALKGSQVRVIILNAAGTGFVAQTTVLTGFGRLRTPVEGPDGNLYITTSNGNNTDRILKVTPS